MSSYLKSSVNNYISSIEAYSKGIKTADERSSGKLILSTGSLSLTR